MNVENITSRTLEEETKRWKESSDVFRRIEARPRHRSKYLITRETEINDNGFAATESHITVNPIS